MINSHDWLINLNAFFCSRSRNTLALNFILLLSHESDWFIGAASNNRDHHRSPDWTFHGCSGNDIHTSCVWSRSNALLWNRTRSYTCLWNASLLTLCFTLIAFQLQSNEMYFKTNFSMSMLHIFRYFIEKNNKC